jgi:hypothetical protein
LKDAQYMNHQRSFPLRHSEISIETLAHVVGINFVD